MFITIDIGGTFIKYAEMDNSGELSSRKKIPTPKTNLDDLMESILKLVKPEKNKDIKGLAISCPGTVDKDGTIYYGGSLGYMHEVNFKKELEKYFNIPISIQNDAKCAALAELWLGSMKGIDDGVILVLGSGVGGGIILDGKLRDGKTLASGELSFLTENLDWANKKATYFGLSGSAVSMVKRISEELNLPEGTDGQVVFEYINNKNEIAWEIFEEYCAKIAIQIINLQYILDVNRFSIGGGISAQPIVVETIKKVAKEILESEEMHRANVEIVNCKFKNDANLYGALYQLLLYIDNAQNKL